jgi:hypothetical protein
MNISVQLFAAKWKMIMFSIVVLLAGKLAVMVAAGQMFGLSRLAALRAGETQALATDTGTLESDVCWQVIKQPATCHTVG